MLKHIKNLLKDNLITIAILITISIAILSLIKIDKQVIQINHLDKFKHAFAYFMLCFTWMLALRKTKIDKKLIVFVCFIYGIVIEYLQVMLTTYRFGEILDVVANTTGILIACLIYFRYFKKN